MRNFEKLEQAKEITPTPIFWCAKVAVFLLSVLAASAYSQTSAGGWPRTLRSDGIRIEVYQPQFESWKDGKLEDRVAIAISEKNDSQSTFGTAWLSAKTTIDEDKRMVTLYDVVVKKVIFPSAGPKEQAYVTSTTEALQQWNISMGLDRLLADIAITQNEEPAGDVLSNAPPRIFVRDHPAVLILIDGDPILQRVPGAKIMRVINTPAMIVLDPESDRYFLRGDGYWMVANNVMGPWSKTGNPPASLNTVLEAGDRSAVDTKSQETSVPEIIVSTEPAELIQINGEPQFSAIDDTRLLYVTNTDSDLFMSLPQQRYYVLLSGRWFSAATMDGPWEFVAGSALPADFSRIPGGHPKSAVLASVPGTPEARDAVVAAQVPQTATVDRKKVTFTATYDGDPKFKPIVGTDMSYAINSPDDIIQARGKYYAVSNGIWFVADKPVGPWSVCDFVPPEIYSVPPTVPVYHVKYVYVYDSTPDWVYVGYAPGYFGAFIWDGVVVYGTGFYYPYWYGIYYFGWPWTWGFGFHYAYWGGGFFWRPWYPRPWYWHRWAFQHNPPLWWNRVLYNRSVARTVNQATFRNTTVYDRWRAPAVISRHPVPLRAPGRIATRREVTTARRGARPRRDIYADRNGQVYSHQSDGWYRRNGQAWEKVQPRVATPTAPTPQARPPVTQQIPQTRPRSFEELERSRQARIQRQNRVDQYRAMPPPARTTAPPPRISAPRMPAPAPHMSAPAPRMTAPRGGGVRQ